MRKFKKMFAVLAASALVAAMPLTAMAEKTNYNETFKGNGKASITVKLPELPAGSTATNTYKVYRVFDATSDGTNISYKLNENHTNKAPDGFTVDNAGNVRYTGAGTDDKLTQDDINSIKSYVTNADLVATVTTGASDKEFTLTGLPYGYYYIATTTGTLVTVDSTNPNATVQDKNTVPTLDKKITGVTAGSLDEDGKKALAQVGTTVTYSATITVGKGAEGYVFHDNMGNGLKLVNGSIEVKDDDSNVTDPIVVKDYTLTTNNTDEDTIKIAFEDAYTGQLQEGTIITIEYKATVTSDALTYGSEDGKNTASLDYGDSSGTNSTPTKDVKVYNAKFTVNKNQPNPENPDDATKNLPLAGAGFIIQNAEHKFYKFTAATTGDNVTGVEWVDNENEATEHTSSSDGTVPAFTGLKDGTYTLIEKTVPAGYNKAEDYTFTIKAEDYTQQNLEKSATVTNYKGIELPHTGGIGTTVFAVAGLVIMAGAAAVLVIKKRS